MTGKKVIGREQRSGKWAGATLTRNNEMCTYVNAENYACMCACVCVRACACVCACVCV